MNISYNPVPTSDALFSIIIPTWNNLEYLKICVESIRKNSAHKHQIVLHINEGLDGTLEWARQNNLAFTHSSENIGICFGCNAAYSLCTSDYILYLNDDMYVCPDWDVALADEIKKSNSIYFYFSSTMIEWKDTGNPAVLAPYDFGSTPDTFREEELILKTKELSKLKKDWSGSMWPPSIMHRKMWDLIGGFSIEFSPGLYSDPDICKKLWDAGCRNFKGIGSSLVYHFMSKSTGKISYINPGKNQFMKKWGIRAKFFKKHYLKMGEDYSGLLTEPKPELMKKENRIVALKKLFS